MQIPTSYHQAPSTVIDPPIRVANNMSVLHFHYKYFFCERQGGSAATPSRLEDECAKGCAHGHTKASTNAR
jgi:hypothetical protein